MKRKEILTSIITIFLISALFIAGTLAYFSDIDDTSDTFTVGNVNIELTEPEWDRGIQTDLDYAKLIPGKTIKKDPTITVLDHCESCYVRVKVTIPSALKGILEDIRINPGWKLCKKSGEDYYYEFNGIVKCDTTLISVFNKLQVRRDASSEDLDSISNDDLSIVIIAQAIQSANFHSQYEAWAAFDAE